MQDEELYATGLEIRILAKMVASIATRSLEQHLREHGVLISMRQHRVMRLLIHDQYTINELSRRMNLAPATLVPVIDALERQGYVQRGKDPNDRRRSPLILTTAGADLLARVPLSNRSDTLACALRSLGAEPTRELLRLLRELLRHMMPEDVLADHLASIAQTAHDMFRVEAAAGGPTSEQGDAPERTQGR